VDESLPIGRFARLSGLSVGALRHYDELDLLRPARTDPITNYRLYRRDQLPAARTIVRLRDLEVPLETIRELLASDDPADQRRLLREHRTRIEARTVRLQRVLHILGQLSSEDSVVMTTSTASTEQTELDPATRRKLAADLFNHTWTLLERADRTPEQDDEMIHSAHASRYHWGEVPDREAVNLARGGWQCSRVYAVLGRAEPALHHARRCVELCEQHGIGDWDLGFAYEALARAHAVAGDVAETRRWLARAQEQAGRVAEADDREHLLGDLVTITPPSG
jgi:DNA-binding transcriptional MerR regulator